MYENIMPLKFYFDKDIISNYEENIVSQMVYKEGYYVIVINITNDNFETNIRKELANVYPNFINSSGLVSD